MREFIEYIQNNLHLLIIGAISTVLAAYFVRFLLQWWEDSWLYSLNKYLKRGKSEKVSENMHNPKITEFFQLLMLILFILGILLFFFDLFTMPWNNSYLLFLLLSLFALFAMIWEHRPLKRDTKGLVGIISHKIKEVLPSSVNSSFNSPDEIYFATHVDRNNNELSYEDRLPILDKDDIEKERNSRIVSYYEGLKQKINDFIEKKIVSKELFYIEDNHICDYLLQEPYSLSSIMKHINAVSESMESDNSINFIGDKIGVSGYDLNKGILSLKIYLTDHFTFKVFKDIFLDKQYKENFQIINQVRLDLIF